ARADHPDHLVARHDTGKGGLSPPAILRTLAPRRQVPLGQVEVGAAHPAGRHGQAHLAGARVGAGPLDQPQGHLAALAERVRVDDGPGAHAQLGRSSSLPLRSPRANAEMLAAVVAAMCSMASWVKKAWCPVTRTLGKVSRRVKTSSVMTRSDWSSKNSSSSSSYTSSPR